MYDFTIKTASGENVTLSEMLAEKDMVLLNFFFTTCGPCANEFPYMQEAYEMYQDNVAVIALDPLEQDDAVAGYQASMGLTFPMAACPAVWSSTFSITGYPTSVIVDRYGMICLIEVGGITSLRPFTSIFETFTGDDYEQKIYGNVSELITNVKPTYEMDSSENVAAALNSTEIALYSMAFLLAIIRIRTKWNTVKAAIRRKNSR
jgi:thiol-disulfide isomerase/thioredoxin